MPAERSKFCPSVTPCGGRKIYVFFPCNLVADGLPNLSRLGKLALEKRICLAYVVDTRYRRDDPRRLCAQCLSNLLLQPWAQPVIEQLFCDSRGVQQMADKRITGNESVPLSPYGVA